LADWDAALPKFKKIMPRDYRRVLEERKRRSMEDRELEAVAHG
jgi:glutamate synthase domain-containing protein 3